MKPLAKMKTKAHAVKVGTDAFTAMVFRLDGWRNFPSVSMFIANRTAMHATITMSLTVQLTFFSPITIYLLSCSGLGFPSPLWCLQITFLSGYYLDAFLASILFSKVKGNAAVSHTA